MTTKTKIAAAVAAALTLSSAAFGRDAVTAPATVTVVVPATARPAQVDRATSAARAVRPGVPIKVVRAGNAAAAQATVAAAHGTVVATGPDARAALDLAKAARPDLEIVPVR